MMNKDEYIEFLKSNKTLQRALEELDVEQAKKVNAVVEEFGTTLIDNITKLMEKIRSNPEYVRALRQELLKKTSDAVNIVEEEKSE